MASAKPTLDPFCDGHPIFGDTLKLDQISNERLPTEWELINVIRGLKKVHTKLDGTIEKSDQTKIYSEIATFLTEIWKTNAHIPVLEFDYAKTALQTHFDKILSDARKNRARILKSDETKKIFISKLQKAFNFAKCRCFVSPKNILKFENIEDIKRSNCKCKPKDRIPLPCLMLFADQMFRREHIIWFSEEEKEKIKQEMEACKGMLMTNVMICSQKLRVCIN